MKETVWTPLRLTGFLNHSSLQRNAGRAWDWRLSNKSSSNTVDTSRLRASTGRARASPSICRCKGRGKRAGGYVLWSSPPARGAQRSALSPPPLQRLEGALGGLEGLIDHFISMCGANEGGFEL